MSLLGRRAGLSRTAAVLAGLALLGAAPAGAHTLGERSDATTAGARAAYADALARFSARSRLAGAAALPAQLGANLSGNVEYLGSRPDEGGQLASGGKLVDGHFYMSGAQHISIYDVAKPEDPQLTARIPFPAPRFENEDITTNGKILLYSDFATTGSLYVYDVSDKRNPRQVAELPGAGRHTMTCLRDCRFAYGSYTVNGPNGPNTGGEVVDLRDPANPKVVGDWTDNGVLESRRVHDVTEVAPGRVLTAASPLKLLDTDASLVEPKVLAQADNTERLHNVVWPRGGRDRFIFTGFETNGTPDCTDSGEVKTFDASAWERTGRFEPVASFRLRNGTGADGNPPANTGLGCSPHWFEPRPDFEDGGVIAMGAYDHGLRFLRADGTGRIEEIGRFLGDEAEASAAYWITDDIVYVVDYVRGLDIVRLSEPAKPRGAGAPESGPDGEPAGPASDPAPSSSPSPSPSPAATPSPGTGPQRFDVSLAVDRTNLRTALRRGIRVRLRCSAACSAEYGLSASGGEARRLGLGKGSRRVASRSARLGGAGRRVVRLRLSRQARRGLERVLRRGRGTTRLRLEAVVTGQGAGTRRTVAREVRLSAGRRPARR